MVLLKANSESLFKIQLEQCYHVKRSDESGAAAMNR